MKYCCNVSTFVVSLFQQTPAAMTPTTLPLNSREYHEAKAAHHAAEANRCASRAILGSTSDESRCRYHENLSAYHAAEALTALPAQTAPEGLAR